MNKILLFTISVLLTVNCTFSQSIYQTKYNTKLNPVLHNTRPILPQEVINYDQSNYFTAGIISYNIHYPSKQKLSDFNQKGFFIGTRRNTTNIDEIILSDLLGLHFNIGGENTFGFATGTNYIKYPDNTLDTIIHYTGTLNLYSTNINSELIVRLPLLDRKIIGGISLTFFNIGVTGSYMKSGRFTGKVFGAVDIIPFYIQIYGKLALKNATFGAGMFINPYSFAEYRFGPKDFVGDDSGLFLNSAQFTKYAFMFLIYFK